jgi:hypothetical protein
MAVTDRIFISTQQDIQLLDFKTEIIGGYYCVNYCVLLHLIFAVTRSSFRLIRMFLTYSSSEVLDCSLIKGYRCRYFLVNKYVINVLSSDKELQSEYRKQNDQ